MMVGHKKQRRRGNFYMREFGDSVRRTPQAGFSERLLVARRASPTRSRATRRRLFSPGGEPTDVKVFKVTVEMP